MAVMDAYIRVSRVGGRSGEAYRSPDLQRAAIERWAKTQDVTIARWEQEEDVSGAKPVADRSLEQLIRRAEQGATDGVVVDKVDRFGRTMAETVLAVKRLKDAGARLAGAGDGFDSSHQYGPLLLGMWAGLAEVHLDNIRNGWERAITAAVAEGKHVAAKAPLGYLRADQAEPRYDEKGDLIRDARLVVDPATGAAVTEAFRLRAAGKSHGEVVAYLEETLGRGVAKSGVTGMLRNRVYLGEARGPNGAVKAGAHEALVDAETFARVQARTSARQRKTGAVAGQAKLRGVIRCAACGHKLRVLGAPKGGASYVCAAKYAGGDCTSPAAARVQLVDEWVAEQLWDAWDEVTADVASAERAYIEARDRVTKLEAEYDKLASDTDLILGLGADRVRNLLLNANEAVQEARRELFAMEDPGVGDRQVVTVGGQPFAYEVWGEDVEADRRLLASVIERVTLAKADPARRRWQPISERVTIKWRGQDA